MKIMFVTLTGADDNTKHEELLRISSKYPFVEWAILFSQNKSGNAERYPGWDWVVELAKQAGEENFSAHLCGKWVDDAMNGQFTLGLSSCFGRVQLNMAQGRLSKALKPESLVWEAVTKVGKPVIFGGPYQKYNLQVDAELFTKHGVLPLFDASGGRGQLTKTWPEPVEGVMCGYAGGLGPENLEDELKKIEDVVGDRTIWIDMESRIRTKGEFDLSKCERVCEIVGNFV